jgi:hypothetical protein
MKLPLFLTGMMVVIACGRVAEKSDHTRARDSSLAAPHAANTPAPSTDPIQVSLPLPNTRVTSPLRVTGQARGSWYFEASFPVLLLDGQGDTLAAAPARAQGEWMTENPVPFEATLTFSPPPSGWGTLVLKKDNPSGDPARDDELRIPVRFN